MIRTARTRLGGALAAVAAATFLLPIPASAEHVLDVPDDPALPAASLPVPVDVTRVGGADRIATAVQVSMHAFDAAGSVVLARSDDPADALSGAPLAGLLDAPVLLTPSADVPASVLAEIERLGARTVHLLGGTAAISAAAESTLTGAGLDVVRYDGATRFDTAAAVAGVVLDGEPGATVFVVEGYDPDPRRAWPDAVSVGAYATFLGAPILPVTTDVLPASIVGALSILDPGELVLVGGTAAISEAVETALTPGEDEEGPSVRRLAGADRYATSGTVYDESVTRGMDPAAKWLATGARFPDALAMGPAAADSAAPALLVPPDVSGAASAARIPASWDVLTDVVVVGGTAAITPTGLGAVEALVADPALPDADLCLTVLHNNDGESQVLNAGSGLESFGGADRFATRFLTEVARGQLDREGCTDSAVLRVTSGDNFLAGPEFNASQDHGLPFYDSILLDYLNYDAIDLGNHDFDFGPEVTADLIEGLEETDDAVFLSANLDFSAQPDIQAQVAAGKVAPSTTVELGGHTVGVIGITPPNLRQISSPGPDIVIGGVAADGTTDVPAVAAIVNDEAATLVAEQGADIIVLISHLQNLELDTELVPSLDAVDIVVAGGGDEVLATPGELLVPGDETAVASSYPTFVQGSDVPVVTTAGNYKYVGRLVTRFDASGDLLDVDERASRMVRVAGAPMPDAVTSDAFILANVVEPVADYLEDLATTIIGTSSVALDGTRVHVRTQETNVGNLLTDSFIATAQAEAAGFGLDETATMVAFTNGGGIRNDSIIDAGDITLLDTFDIAPFSNFVVVIEDVTVAQLDTLLEHGYAATDTAAGQFAQLGNLRVEVDRDAAVGSRVSNIRTADGTPLADGFSLVTINFLPAQDGDGYPFSMLGLDEFTSVGVTYQQALADYIEVTLGGSITAAGYPEAGGYPEISDPPTNALRIEFTDL